MAKYLGLLTTDMRGKIGGIVASRGRTGTTLKAKGVPRLAPTPAQNIQRSRLASALFAWRQLTTLQQLSWGGIAATLTWSNSLANTFTPTGLQLWTQAFINQATLNAVPPSTAGGSPSTVVPITTVTIVTSTGVAQLLVNLTGPTYTGNWAAYLSAPIPASVNYTKTTARRLVAVVAGGNFNFFQTAYIAAFGALPPVGAYTSVRVVPIDPTYGYSGTIFNAPVIWEA